MKHLWIVIALVFAGGVHAQEKQNRAGTLDELLDMVKKGTLQDQTELRRREQEFRDRRDDQQKLLKQAKADLAAEEKRSIELERTFDKNKDAIRDRSLALQQKLGSLKELFGIFQQTAGDLQGEFQNSPISVQYPGREEFPREFAKKMAKASEITTIEEIERLWYELQREMTETGKIVKFKASVLGADGREEEKEIVRIGRFSLVTNDPQPRYLIFRPETQKVAELKRQPASRQLNQIEEYVESKESYEGFALDPTGGALLSRLVDTPTLRERVDQGGLVGYIIIGVGVFALLLAAFKLVTINLMSVRVAMQKRDTANPNPNNPLGRVLAVYHENKKVDTETLEMRLGEAILNETPGINRFVVIIKVISVVAPLMGLLGTVTGMIATFQAITLFGTGDPKTMAGGISQALVTTVLGLVVAIPTVILHTIVSTRAKSVVHSLEHQAAGLIAEQMEAKNAA